MKILMVCLGNICRSPLAEGIMRHLINDEKLNWEVSSAGTGDVETGRPADHRSINIAQTYGYDISRQRVRHFDQSMFDDFDHIFVMDKHNFNDVMRLTANDDQRKKVRFFLKDDEGVANPYLDDSAFEGVLLKIEERVKTLIPELRQQYGQA